MGWPVAIRDLEVGVLHDRLFIFILGDRVAATAVAVWRLQLWPSSGLGDDRVAAMAVPDWRPLRFFSISAFTLSTGSFST